MKEINSKAIHIAVVAVLLFTAACAPVFSELQSARLAGVNHTEITPSFSAVSAHEGGNSEGIQNHLGAQIAYGVHPQIDLRLRYEYIWLTGFDEIQGGTSILAFGPKFSLVTDRLALYLPVGRALEEGQSWEFQPTIFFTHAFWENKLDFTIAPKYVVTLCEGCEDLLAFNFGLALGKDVRTFAIRPEYGILLNPGQRGSYHHFSIGISAMLGGIKK